MAIVTQCGRLPYWQLGLLVTTFCNWLTWPRHVTIYVTPWLADRQPVG